MEIKIDEINRRIQININPKDWYIVEVDEKAYVWEKALAPKIDRSYKDPDIGYPKILLNQQEYEKIKGLVDEVYE